LNITVVRPVRHVAVKPFTLPQKSLGGLDADVAARLIAASADVALIVDSKGFIRDMALEGDELSHDGAESWIGRRWIDTVTADSRSKVEELLSSAGRQAVPHWRQVNHPSPRGLDVPVRYATVETGRQGMIVAVGRNLSAMSALQQRIVESQREMEAEYTRLRQAETRYRALFHNTSEAVLIVDLSTLKVVEANPAALQVTQRDQRKLVGRNFVELFHAKSAAEVQALLAELRVSPRGSNRQLRLADQDTESSISASLFRQEAGACIIVRIGAYNDAADGNVDIRSSASVEKIVEALPDAFVVTDRDGRIVATNAAFLELVQLATEDQAKGQPIDRWVGRTSVDMSVLMANLREHHTMRRFNSVARGEFGASEDVEISAVSALNSNPPSIGLVLRRIERRDNAVGQGGTAVLSRSVEQMTELVGRVPLRDLVRETTDIMERMCIEAALQLTKDNRASAAEMLGLSRQGLYMKLRRYGIGDLPAENE
jgi:transcriptional regulator PpsR